MGKFRADSITDDPLTPLGWQQMQSAVAQCHHWNDIISSLLQRCLNFSRDYSWHQQIPLLIDPDWQEIDFGDWEGETVKQINSEALLCFYQNPLHYTPRNAELYFDFQKRVRKAWNGAVQHYSGNHLLIVTHTGVK